MSDVGTIDLSATQYAARQAALLALVKDIRGVGGEVELDLPRIAVIGNQSAGKSSVVEAISGISVPRDVGTCTRYPMECRLSPSDAWSCQVSIHWIVSEKQKLLDTIIEAHFGDVIRDKSEVEERLRRAQIAILNPKSKPKKNLNMGITEIRQHSSSLAFPQNVVCVDIAGPQLTHISFVDLPDIVRLLPYLFMYHSERRAGERQDGERNGYVPYHWELYYFGGNADAGLDDIENQMALQLAADPEGSRTIVTALKRRSSGLMSLRAVVIVSHMATFAPANLTILNESAKTSSDHRSAEEKFFSSTEPWSTSSQKDRFGIHNLVKTLSGLLMRIIGDGLPAIQAEAAACLSVCNAELASLPPLANAGTNPVTHVLNVINKFNNDIGQYVQGGVLAASLVQSNRSEYRTFKIAIRRTAPILVPFRNAAGVPSSDRAACTGIEANRLIYLEDVQKMISESTGRELPGHVPYDVNTTLIKRFQESWAKVAKDCLNAVYNETREIIIDRIPAVVAPLENLRTLLRDVVSEIMDSRYYEFWSLLSTIIEAEASPYTQNTHYLSETRDKWLANYKGLRSGKQPLMGLFSKPFTSSTESPPRQRVDRAPSESNGGGDSDTDSQDSGSDDYTLDVRAIARKPTPSAERSLVIGYTGLKANDLERLNPTDEFEAELRVFAETRSYFQISYKRVIDIIPALIDLKFVKAIHIDLQPLLIAKLDLGNTDAVNRCLELLAQDPKVVARRIALTSQKKSCSTYYDTGFKLESKVEGLTPPASPFPIRISSSNKGGVDHARGGEKGRCHGE
ncbi:Dynamin central region-domain-containing protein [Mycena latifolia]|nr:Dynamin central region-domain-containing protein [Mycena latifolia]